MRGDWFSFQFAVSNSGCSFDPRHWKKVLESFTAQDSFIFFSPWSNEGRINIIYFLFPCLSSSRKKKMLKAFSTMLLLINTMGFYSVALVKLVVFYSLSLVTAIHDHCIYRASREGWAPSDDILPANLFAERWAHIFRMMTDQNIWLSVSVSVSFFKTWKLQHITVKILLHGEIFPS